MTSDKELYTAIVGDSHGYHHIIYNESKKLKQSIDKIIDNNNVDNKIIYVDDFGIEVCKSTSINEARIYLADQYLYLSIIKSILKGYYEPKILELFKDYNNGDDITSFKELNDSINRTQNKIKELYKECNLDFFSELELDIGDYCFFEMLLKDIAKIINVDRYTVILDNKSDIENTSKKSVNSLIGSRITHILTCILVTPYSKWGTYIDNYNNVIESVHDYISIDYDESYKKYVKEKKYGK